MGMLSRLIDAVTRSPKTIVKYVDRFYENLRRELSGVTSYFKDGYNSIRDAANNTWDNVMGSIESPEGIFDRAISTAQAMSTAAVDKITTMTDMVTALTNWTIGFVVGFFQGFFDVIKYGIEKGFLPLKAFFLSSAAGAYELGTRLVWFPYDVINAYWDFTFRIAFATGPFSPIVAAFFIFLAIVVMLWFAKVVPPWIIARLAERA